MASLKTIVPAPKKNDVNLTITFQLCVFVLNIYARAPAPVLNGWNTLRHTIKHIKIIKYEMFDANAKKTTHNKKHLWATEIYNIYTIK